MQSQIESALNPLTISVNASSLDESGLSHEGTPVKNGNIESQTCYTNTSGINGLLAYSTPVLQNRFKFISTPNAFAMPVQKSTPKEESYKPRVNFHSIDDIIGNKSEEQESMGSSGYASNESDMSPYYNQKLMFQNICQQLIAKQTKDESINEEFNNEEKELVVKQSNYDSKKVRTTFTDYQKKQLDVYFQKNPYPDPRELEDLTQQLGLAEAVIKVWFQNKRSRDKQRKFSHSNRAALRQKENMQKGNENISSPLVANLQMLSSRINSSYYAAAALSALQNQNVYRNSFY
jgi:hypothetical protein